MGGLIRSGDRIATGTGAGRRRLTLEEAAAGGLPDRMTRAEWDAMHAESLLAEANAEARHQARLAVALDFVGRDPDPDSLPSTFYAPV